MTLRRTEMPPRTKPMGRTPFPRTPPTIRTVAAVKRAHRADTIPPKVRQLVNARDPWSILSGTPYGLEIHHRRLKGSGGDPRPHTDCPCNLIRLTRDEHAWVHAHRAEAEAEGFILPAETVFPGSVSVLFRSADGGASLWPSCDGTWLSEAPEGAVA
jgi:hypothetical protein